MKKCLSNFLIFVFCIILCNGCSCKKEEDLVVYRNFYNQDVTTFNYMTTNLYQNVIRIANLVDGLVENDKYGNIVPSIAKSWKSEMLDNKLVWTFYLKDNIYWSDYKGNKYALVTAYDFVTALKYILNYNTSSSNYNLAASLLENGLNYYNATLIKNFNYHDIISKVNSLSQHDPNNELSYYQNIKKVFDSCNSTNKCNDDFSTVGVKAINDFELQYTLEKPVPYFLSALTYYSFLPANEKFIKEVGFNNFGTSKKTILYNGGYLLKDYFHSSRIEYIKNNNYWDKDNIFIDKLIFTKSPSYQTASYSRLMYESGNIDEFYLNKNDTEGMKKYIYGKNGTGNENNPVGNNTYVFDEKTDFTTYYIIFNQNRTNHKYSTLSSKEISITNRAMNNLNFRKALTYGLSRSSYLTNNLYNSLSSIVPKDFVHNENTDYYDYFIKTYASKNNISYEEAQNILSSDPFYNIELSKYYLDLAISELTLNEMDLPIKVEYTYYYDNDYTLYDKERIRKWNYALNGCSLNDNNCVFNKIEIVYNTSVTSTNYYHLALANREYNLTFIGLYPDFVDPTAYLNSIGSNGELSYYLNHAEGEFIDNKLDTIENNMDLNERFKICSLLEYYIIFEKNLLLPLSLNTYDKQIVVSNLVPYQKMKSNYGLSPFKFKFKKIAKSKLSQNDIDALKEEYDKGRFEK